MTPATDAEARSSIAVGRRRLVIDGMGIVVSAFSFAIVLGLAARTTGFSLVETIAFSVIVFAGAAQFAAVGLVAVGTPWVGIVLLTALLNARHLLYSAALAPWFAGTSLATRLGAAYLLTDEAFALTVPYFRRIGRFDGFGYLVAALVTWVPWNLGTILGYVGGQLFPEPRLLGLDVVFPAAMAGLATVLVTRRREVVAAAAGLLIATSVALTLGTSIGVVAGGILGPLVAMLAPLPAGREADERTPLDGPVPGEGPVFARPPDERS